eukprot:106372-Prymnesium_polylepis.1
MVAPGGRCRALRGPADVPNYGTTHQSSPMFGPGRAGRGRAGPSARRRDAARPYPRDHSHPSSTTAEARPTPRAAPARLRARQGRLLVCRRALCRLGLLARAQPAFDAHGQHHQARDRQQHAANIERQLPAGEVRVLVHVDDADCTTQVRVVVVEGRD